MLYEDTLFSRALNLLAGTLVYFVIITGLTYYFQSSLLVVKLYGSYAHWAVVLLALPILAGIAQRLLRITYPIATTLAGAIASAVVLYPMYSERFWAQAPSVTVTLVYVLIITGIGFMATQPLKTVFLMAFRKGRFSLPSVSLGSGGGKKRKPARKADMSATQRLQAGGHGNFVAMMELLVGFASLALSIFSIFFLGRG
jgi:hypothetical protein